MAKNAAAGIYEILDVRTGQRISKFRARKQADVDRHMNMARIGLKLDDSEIKLVFIAERED